MVTVQLFNRDVQARELFVEWDGQLRSFRVAARTYVELRAESSALKWNRAVLKVLKGGEFFDVRSVEVDGRFALLEPLSAQLFAPTPRREEAPQRRSDADELRELFESWWESMKRLGPS